MKNPTSKTRRRIGGMTVLEALLAFSILVLIGIAFMTLYVTTLRNSTRVTGITYTAWDAANAIDRINLSLREARRFEFMDNGTTGPPLYRSVNTGNNNNYFATLPDGTAIVTGIHIVFPAPLTSVSVNVPAGSGMANTAMVGTNALMNYKTDGAYLDVYRADEQGHPAPTNGTCVWIRGTIEGATVSTDPKADTAMGIDGKPLIRDLASWAGSFQIIQGLTNEVQIKVVTGTYDPVNKELTSESTKGAVTSLSAQHVYLRNHDPNGVSAGSAHGKTQYTGN